MQYSILSCLYDVFEELFPVVVTVNAGSTNQALFGFAQIATFCDLLHLALWFYPDQNFYPAFLVHTIRYEMTSE